MTDIQEHLFYPLLVSLIAFIAFSLYKFFQSKAKKLKIAEDLERVTQIKAEISKMVEDRNAQQDKQLETFTKGLGHFNQALQKMERNTNELVSLNKKLNDDLVKFQQQIEKIEKRIDTDYKLFYKILEKFNKSLIKLQTTHNFCHPDHKIEDNDH